MEKIPSNQRPKDMSQLDWLWQTFKDVTIKSDEGDSSISLLSEKAIKKLTNNTIKDLSVLVNADDVNKLDIVGLDENHKPVTTITIDRGEYIESVEAKKAGELEISDTLTLGEPILLIKTSSGKSFSIKLTELISAISSRDTLTISTEVYKGVVQANVRIDTTNNQISPVELVASKNGLYNKLKLNNKGSNIILENTEEGLRANTELKSLRWKLLSK